MRLVVTRSARLRRGAADTRLAHFFRAIAENVPPRSALVDVIWIGERGMARLNREYKRRTGAPEILSFPCAGGPDPGREIPLGEIYLCRRRLIRGAKRRGVPVRSYAARLLVHGLFHLRGWRHDGAALTERMEAAEARFLRAYLSRRDVERLFD
jgi:probable rRNA maturation factor